MDVLRVGGHGWISAFTHYNADFLSAEPQEFAGSRFFGLEEVGRQQVARIRSATDGGRPGMPNASPTPSDRQSTERAPDSPAALAVERSIPFRAN